jgi:diguanylate cyclase (GGDEF)-like protein
VPPTTRSGRPEERSYNHWDRARLSVVVPIGAIVAVAIVCIVVAVLSSARRADEISLNHEQHMFNGALGAFGKRMLHDVESIARSEGTARTGRDAYDREWARRVVDAWRDEVVDHDMMILFGAQDEPLYAQGAGATRQWLAAAGPEFAELIAVLRGNAVMARSTLRLDRTDPNVHGGAAVLRRLLGRPAVIAASVVTGSADPAAGPPSGTPILMSIKFVDERLMAMLAGQLHLTDLRLLPNGPVPDGEFADTVRAADGSNLVRVAWTPKQPGSDIVRSVAPFITVALAGFALLAAFVLRYMRRTAATIAAGESRLRFLAMHDPLCGLPNRIYFGERLEETITDVRNGSGNAAVFYIDLDHFKDVNDTLGHNVGDELIRNVTLRLSNTLRDGDLVARLGGDEFAVISQIAEDPERLLILAQRIIKAICAPYSVAGHNIVIGASVGIAVVDRNCAGAADIMRYADMALYRAKNEGRNRACIYDADMDAALSSRKLLEGDLREAIAGNGLRVVYQPIVDKSGEILTGVEALCRWKHPVRGDIPPTEFIALAEHSGCILELGAFVLRQACLDGLAWPALSVAVNVSPLQFRRADFVEQVERILDDTGFDPTRLELELTESVLLGNVDSAEAAMLRLKALGVRIALDDFGTGYSSLLYLRRYPFDKLKIDRSFVHSIEKAADAAAIVHAVVGLGRGLGMKVTAEGVETADQHLFLRAAGVHFIQGYRFGAPMPAEAISLRVDEQARATATGRRAAMAG